MKHPNNLVPQGVSKLQDVKFGSKNFKICHLVTLVPLEVQGCALLFWKRLINIFKEPDCHGCCSTLNISQFMLKIEFFIVSYYKRLKTMNRNVTCPFDKPYGSLKVSRCKPPPLSAYKISDKRCKPPI